MIRPRSFGMRSGGSRFSLGGWSFLRGALIGWPAGAVQVREEDFSRFLDLPILGRCLRVSV
eukprot:2891110-Alexandrium_andersonii.AAC.1